MVTIESAQDFRRPKQVTATVVRVAGPHIFVKVRSPRGATFQECYGRRDGIRVGGVSRAELGNADSTDSVGTPAERSQVQRIHGLYRALNRYGGDVETLRELHASIGD